MKVVTIGDVHGRDDWKKIAERADEFHKIIFVGDYFDSFDIPIDTQIRNLKEIFDFKLLNKNKVVNLIGNHDSHYLRPFYGFCSGWNEAIANNIEHFRYLFREHCQVAYQMDTEKGPYLWTHAGVSKSWFDDNIVLENGNYSFKKRDASFHSPELADLLNLMWAFDYGPLFKVDGYRSMIRNSVNGGPLWLDKRNAVKNPLKGYHQIVGHTPGDKIDHYKFDDIDASMTFVDAPDYDDFYELNI